MLPRDLNEGALGVTSRVLPHIGRVRPGRGEAQWLEAQTTHSQGAVGVDINGVSQECWLAVKDVYLQQVYKINIESLRSGVATKICLHVPKPARYTYGSGIPYPLNPFRLCIDTS